MSEMDKRFARRVPEGPKSHKLRVYRATAQTTHYCDRCSHDIEPGDRYQATVYVVTMNPVAHPRGLAKFIDVSKEHIEPQCPEPDPFEYWDEQWDDEDLFGLAGLADVA